MTEPCNRSKQNTPEILLRSSAASVFSISRSMFATVMLASEKDSVRHTAGRPHKISNARFWAGSDAYFGHGKTPTAVKGKKPPITSVHSAAYGLLVTLLTLICAAS